MRTKAIDPHLAQLAVIAQGIYRKQAELTALAELLDLTIDSLASKSGYDLDFVLNPNRKPTNGPRARQSKPNDARGIPRGAKRPKA